VNAWGIGCERLQDSWHEPVRFICGSYVRGSFAASNSYGLQVQCLVAMKWTLHSSRSAADPVEHPQGIFVEDHDSTGHPPPVEVLFEIGLILSAHLALALAVTLAFPAFGA
jgi:hypothetical protein